MSAELAVAGRRAKSSELADVIAPRLVAGEEQSILADPTPFDLRDQPPRGEPDRPTGVGVDLLARLDPVEEAASDQLDVGTHPAAEMYQVDLDVIPVALDQRPDLVDV